MLNGNAPDLTPPQHLPVRIQRREKAWAPAPGCARTQLVGVLLSAPFALPIASQAPDHVGDRSEVARCRDSTMQAVSVVSHSVLISLGMPSVSDRSPETFLARRSRPRCRPATLSRCGCTRPSLPRSMGRSPLAEPRPLPQLRQARMVQHIVERRLPISTMETIPAILRIDAGQQAQLLERRPGSGAGLVDDDDDCRPARCCSRKKAELVEQLDLLRAVVGDTETPTGAPAAFDVLSVVWTSRAVMYCEPSAGAPS